MKAIDPTNKDDVTAAVCALCDASIELVAGDIPHALMLLLAASLELAHGMDKAEWCRTVQSAHDHIKQIFLSERLH